MHKLEDFDLNTINMEELSKLPSYDSEVSHYYHVDNHYGSACFLEPPGHPSYFIQSIYTFRGDHPYEGAQQLLLNHIISTDKTDHKKDLEPLLRRLYKKPKYNSFRVKAWEENLYSYFRSCYVNDSIGDKALYAENLLIFPIPFYKLNAFHIPYLCGKAYLYSRELRNKRKEKINWQNNRMISEAKKIAIPENHAAFRHVKEWYPRAKPRLDLISKPPRTAPHWYERLLKKPTPENCIGEDFQEHPVNGTWCQVCGWKKE